MLGLDAQPTRRISPSPGPLAFGSERMQFDACTTSSDQRTTITVTKKSPAQFRIRPPRCRKWSRRLSPILLAGYPLTRERNGTEAPYADSNGFDSLSATRIDMKLNLRP